jgi:hypothetical protein
MRKRLAIVSATACMALVLAADPSSAKGISYAHFEGPGLPPGGVTIHGDNEVLWQTGLAGEKSRSPHDFLVPKRDLGTAYQARYHVDYAPKATLYQTIYPYAPGGPVTFMEQQHLGQDFGSFPRGWHQGYSKLFRFLVANGFPAHDPNAEPVVHVKTAAGAVPDRAPGGSGAWPWILGALAALSALGATALATRRLRRKA